MRNTVTQLQPYLFKYHLTCRRPHQKYNAYISKFIRCIQLSCQPLQQLMSDLPPSRVSSIRCFLHSAVDYVGSYALKITHGRGAKSTKAYIFHLSE